MAIRGEKKVARCPLWGKSGVSHRKSPLGVLPVREIVHWRKSLEAKPLHTEHQQL